MGLFDNKPHKPSNSMRTRTKIILGIILAFPVFLGIGFVVSLIWQVTDPEGHRNYFDELEAEREAEKTRLAETPKGYTETIASYSKPKDQSVSVSGIQSETKYENMVLNYKGKDGKGFTIEDFANAKCLKDQQGSSAQYMDDNFDDKSGYHSILVTTPVNINLNPPCLGGGWWFGVNNQGNVIAWEYDSAEEILDYLDTQGK